MPDIGLLNEKPLHASLKQWCAKPGDRFEVAVDGFVVDIVQGDLLLEIQTGSFASIKSKLFQLVDAHQIRLIYPIPKEKWIVKLPQIDGEDTSRRKSPKRGHLVDLFWEMVSFPHLLEHPNFELEVLLTREEEVRRFVSRKRWRRKGWGIEERRLVDVAERKLFEDPSDWRELLPENLPTPFTTRDLAEGASINLQLAQKMTYCLRKTGVIEPAGKRRHAPLYEIVR